MAQRTSSLATRGSILADIDVPTSLLAGLAGTVAFTILLYAAPLMGLWPAPNRSREVT